MPPPADVSPLTISAAGEDGRDQTGSLLALVLARIALPTPDHGEPVVLSARGGAGGEVVARIGDVVVKIHSRGTPAEALAVRLRIAADPRLTGVLLAPLDLAGTGRTPLPVGDRLVTAWPAGVPVDPHDPDRAPWEQAGALLARLHAVPAGTVRAPASGGPARVARAVARLRAASGHDGRDDRWRSAATTILRAYDTLPPWARDDPRAAHGGTHPAPGGTHLVHGGTHLVHGDWHLGQLARFGADWLLIDIDTLGTGDPAWGLARPAAWYAAGVLDPAVWRRLLDGYLDAGGPGVSPADPWAALDVPARALAVQSAATAVAKAGTAADLDEDELALVDCCSRMLG